MSLKIINKNFYINISIILIIFILDRLTKLYIIYLDKINNGSEIFVSKFLDIYLIWNEGIAFGLLSFKSDNLYDILSTIIIIIILVLCFLISQSEGIKKYSLAMIIGGALGNVFDRVLNKAVPDFIDFHVGNFHWFIFNIADIFITIGVFLMIFLEIIDNNKKKGL